MMNFRSGAIGFVIGAVVSCSAAAYANVTVFVNTNGVLKGYTVQKNGENICSDPSVFIEFRGPESYIVCDDS